jgi:Flp pilus assembly protein TadG
VPVSVPRTRPTRGRARASTRGQSLVEFSLVLMPLFLIMLGIIQFGFIFNAYISMTNSTRDAARLGTVHGYNHACSRDTNDLLRNEHIRLALISAMNPLSATSPRFTTTAATGHDCTIAGGWTKVGSTFTNGDLEISYVVPDGTMDTEDRTGQQVTVRATYHEDLLIPLIAELLPRDAGGRLRVSGIVTMVID